jgi:hypothetical protein
MIRMAPGLDLRRLNKEGAVTNKMLRIFNTNMRVQYKLNSTAQLILVTKVRYTQKLMILTSTRQASTQLFRIISDAHIA